MVPGVKPAGSGFPQPLPRARGNESSLLLSAAAAGRKNQRWGLLLAGCALRTGAAARPPLLREEYRVIFSLKRGELQLERTKRIQLHSKQIKRLKNQTYTMRKTFGLLSKKVKWEKVPQG